MQFLKKFFTHDNVIIGLCGIKKTKEYIKITIPESYKSTFTTNTTNNYLLL
jgi:hypothetical protein